MFHHFSTIFLVQIPTNRRPQAALAELVATMVLSYTVLTVATVEALLRKLGGEENT